MNVGHLVFLHAMCECSSKGEVIPEEESESSSTGEGVGGTGADILAVHLRLTAVTLRTQH